MKKSKLRENLDTHKNETKTALQTLWDNINKGQQKQLIKLEEVKTLFDRYNVEYED